MFFSCIFLVVFHSFCRPCKHLSKNLFGDIKVCNMLLYSFPFISWLLLFFITLLFLHWMTQLLAGMIAEPAFLSEYTVFALDPTKRPKPQSESVVSPSGFIPCSDDLAGTSGYIILEGKTQCCFWFIFSQNNTECPAANLTLKHRAYFWLTHGWSFG